MNIETNTAINFETKTQLIKEFKEAIHNPDFKPTYCPAYGTKFNGELEFKHFIFYAMLRNKNIDKTTHDTNSPRYKFEVSKIKFIASDDDSNTEYVEYQQCLKSLAPYGWLDTNKNSLFESYKSVFPSLTLELFSEIVHEHYEQ